MLTDWIVAALTVLPVAGIVALLAAWNGWAGTAANTVLVATAYVFPRD